MADWNFRNHVFNGNEPGIDTNPSPSGGMVYEIHVAGQLDSRWSEWLEGLEVRLLENGEMILFGPIVDQSALLGILNKLSRLNLTLLSVNKINNAPTEPRYGEQELIERTLYREINKETNE
jgi:hypothetical protein